MDKKIEELNNIINDATAKLVEHKKFLKQQKQIEKLQAKLHKQSLFDKFCYQVDSAMLSISKPFASMYKTLEYKRSDPDGYDMDCFFKNANKIINHYEILSKTSKLLQKHYELLVRVDTSLMVAQQKITETNIKAIGKITLLQVIELRAKLQKLLPEEVKNQIEAIDSITMDQDLMQILNMLSKQENSIQ